MKSLLQELPSAPTLLAFAAAVILLVTIDLEKPSPQTPFGQQAMWRRLPDVQPAPLATPRPEPSARPSRQAWKPAPMVTPPAPLRAAPVVTPPAPSRIYDSISARLQLPQAAPTQPSVSGRLSMNATSARDHERWPYSAPAFDAYSL